MAEFVDITSLSDASDGMNNFDALWVQVSATQRINLFKLANSSQFMKNLQEKLGTTDVLGTVLKGFTAGSDFQEVGAQDTILSAFNKLAGDTKVLQTTINNNYKWAESEGSGTLNLQPRQVVSATSGTGSLGVTLQNFSNPGDSAILILPSSASTVKVTFSSGSLTAYLEENTAEVAQSGDSKARIFVVQKGFGNNLYINGATYVLNS